MGDFNWITDSFVAFASPQTDIKHTVLPADPLYPTIPKTIDAVIESDLKQPVKNVLAHFSERGVGLVVRLNSQLYSPSYFQALGIKHLDMIFEDGTCPKLSWVRRFINLAHDMIARNKAIAVHCKAGLGRTGCLIGAYLIYRYGFTANEVIAFMRFKRPGMVVGPQQHWLHLHQGTFREWWYEDTLKEKIIANMAPTTPTKANSIRQKVGNTFTPPQPSSSYKRPALNEIGHNEQASLGIQDENLPAPTSGQPRKTNKIYGAASPYRRTYNMSENQKPEAQTVSLQQTVLHEADESDGDVAMQLLSSAVNSNKHSSQSPVSRSGKRRAVSCTTTTTTMTKWDIEGSDVENQNMNGQTDPMLDVTGSRTGKVKTPITKSGSGAGSLTVGKRTSPSRRSTEGKTSVRKTSGRVGSIGTATTRARAS